MSRYVPSNFHKVNRFHKKKHFSSLVEEKLLNIITKYKNPVFCGAWSTSGDGEIFHANTSQSKYLKYKKFKGGFVVSGFNLKSTDEI